MVGQAGSRAGCLKKRGWNPLTNYAIRTTKKNFIVAKFYKESEEMETKILS